MTTDAIRSLRRRVLGWYSRNKRNLPWRRTRDPYAIWVSEIMLQQTRVETVAPFYERFLRRFPDAGSLARAREPAVLAAWSGLGYYRRARNLHAAARTLVREHAGNLPEDLDSLMALPGIGRYTAAAIASIAFGRPAAAVDGNVIRVIARIEGLRGRGDSAALRREVDVRAESLARGARAGDWTQALMELGATICLPRDPLCERCPAARFCAARRSGDPDRFPEASIAKAPRAEQRVLLVARSGRRVLLVPDEGDSRATWTLPYARLATPSRRAARALARRLFGNSAAPTGPRFTFSHRTFSHSLTYEVWSIELAPGHVGKPSAPREASMGGPDTAFWATQRDLRRMPVRAHTLKALRDLVVPQRGTTRDLDR
jgi:A/G-specific adenine glycosylase